MHCGKDDVLKYEDLRGELHSQMIYSTKSVKCTNCGTEYFIHWKDVDGTMKPYYSDKNIIDDFSKDIIDYSTTHRRMLL
jgi:hypothetical protein